MTYQASGTPFEQHDFWERGLAGDAAATLLIDANIEWDDNSTSPLVCEEDDVEEDDVDDDDEDDDDEMDDDLDETEWEEVDDDDEEDDDDDEEAEEEEDDDEE